MGYLIAGVFIGCVLTIVVLLFIGVFRLQSDARSKIQNDVFSIRYPDANKKQL